MLRLVFLAYIPQYGNKSTNQTYYRLDQYLHFLAWVSLSSFFCLQHACLLIDQVDHCSTVFSNCMLESDNWQQRPTVTADLVAHRFDAEVDTAQSTAAAVVSCLTRMIVGQLPGKQLSKTCIPASFFQFFPYSLYFVRSPCKSNCCNVFVLVA